MLIDQLKNLQEKQDKALDTQEKLKAKVMQQTGSTFTEEITKGVVLKLSSGQKRSRITS